MRAQVAKVVGVRVRSLASVRTLVCVLPPFAALVLSACGGTPTPNIFLGGVPEGGTPPSDNNGDAGDLVNGPDTGTTPVGPAVCNPQSVASFQPAWQPPEAWKQNLCTTTQISGFYAACLTPPIAPQTCNAFIQANANCASCLQSKETDAQASAVVWHEQMKYWTVNVAGCIAQATGDVSTTGCGATYAAAIACRQSSCNACWQAQGTTATFQEFSDCESLAGVSTCQTYAQAVPKTCGDIAKGPGSVCMPPSSATAQDAYMQIAPLFCGQ
jgi:hypothetical protein